MKTNALTTPLLFLFMALISFSGNTANFSGKDKKEERKVADFSEITISIAANVELRQGNECKVVLEGDEDILEKTKTKVSGDELIIKSKKTFNSGWNDEIKIYITTKDIEKISIAGSATMNSKTKIKSERIQFQVSGSGKINILELEAPQIESSISGSGKINIAGTKTSKELDLSISGSGKFNSKQLQIKDADIKISGSGKGIVNITEYLEAGVSGSGRIAYYGNPRINSSVSGSGKIRSAD
ncbi:MAG: head GIN domain-containing protein [Bacteroidota bacterium]